MVTRRLVRAAAPALAIVALLAIGARADSPKLAQARRAVDAVRYDDAQRLLVEALRDGDNSPAAVGEIYQLSARTAIVLSHPELAELYYRRWLTIAPGAALPDDASPKLRAPFVAAQAYVAAHGRLDVRVERGAAGQLEVAVLSDPLAMVRAAIAWDASRRSPSAPIGGDRVARIAGSPGPGARAAVLDEYGNRLVELEVPPIAPPIAPPTVAPPTAAPPTAAPVAPATAPSRAWHHRWQVWGASSVVFAGVALGFGVAAGAAQTDAAAVADDSLTHHLSDAEAHVQRARTFTWVASIGALGMLACATTATVLWFDERGEARARLAPMAAPGQLGVVLVGRF